MAQQEAVRKHSLGFLVPTAGPAPDGGRVRLRTLVLIRWVAILGQSAALIIVHVSLGYALPIWPAILLVALSVAVNLHASGMHPGSAWLGDRTAAVYLAYDLIQLSLLLALTGGLANPFSILLLAPVTVSASVLSRRSTLLLAGAAVASITALALWHLPLPWPGGLDLPALYVVGTWIALVLAVIFIAGYVFSLAAEAQRRFDALSATQMALAREQRLSALGGLAAAAAHELGSPLSTIAVVARELARELPADSPYKEDAELLLQESARCRDILARLAREPESGGSGPFDRLPLSALVETAAAPLERESIVIDIVRRPRDDSPQPEAPRQPEIIHGLGTLVENAVRFAATRVRLEVSWDTAAARVAIRDDGPGFPEDVLPFLGEPYLSSQHHHDDGGGEHMGLGIFIASTLLARTGGEVEFANAPDGGAVVTVAWSRTHLERHGPAVDAREREMLR